jgi:hypothetical protein
MLFFLSILLFIIQLMRSISFLTVYPYPPTIPSYEIPTECLNDSVLKYIKELEHNHTNFFDIKPDSTINSTYCKTIDSNKNIIDVDCQTDLNNVSLGYIWKELSDYPSVIGITKGRKSDHEPHFHNQAECYYAYDGDTLTLSNGTFNPINQTQYLFIPSNVIHNTPILNDKFGVLYWFPFDSNFSSFMYYYDYNVDDETKKVFDIVDQIRLDNNISF